MVYCNNIILLLSSGEFVKKSHYRIISVTALQVFDSVNVRANS